MLKLGLTQRICLLACGLILLSVLPLRADVTVHGKVRVWSPIVNDYVPLRQARVRIVLWEFEDWDTCDLETWTNDNGDYSDTKGNPWWRSGYNVFIKAFAETDRVEIQDTIPQIDGYQAYAAQVWAPQDGSTQINLDIGGPSSNVTGYRCGGTSCFGDADDTSRQNGERAFWICHEMTDHVQWLIANTAIPSRYFEEKECAFPYNDDRVANFSYTWDAVYVPDSTFSGSLQYQSHTFRHELGHGLMLDAYGALHLPSAGTGPSHTFWDPIGSNEQAWKEGSSDFLADWTYSKAYGHPAEQVDTLRNTDRDNSLRAHTGNRDTIEAEIDGALWLLTDPKGWKERVAQVPGRPEPNMWYDAFEDPRFADFWPIFESDEPARFTDMGGEDSDTYINHLAARYPNNKYDLKVLLYQRGIELWTGEHGPRIDWYDAERWEGPDCTIPVYLQEQDQMDLGHLTLEVYVNGARVLQEPIANEGWERSETYRYTGWQKRYDFTYRHVAPRSGHTPSARQAHPVVRFVLDDGMTFGERSYTLNPPAGAQIDDLRCNVWRAVLKNGSGAPLNGVGVNVGLSGTKPAVRLGPWNAIAFGSQDWEGNSQVFRMTGGTVPDSFSLDFTATGSSKSMNASLGTVTQTFSDTDGFGIGDHVAVIPLGGKSGGQVEVSYSIYVYNPTREAMTHIPQSALDQMRGIAPAPAGARTINMDAIRRAAYDTPNGTLRMLAGQAARLLDDYARLQASVLEIEEEIEAKLDPEKAARFNADKGKPTNADPAGKGIRLVRVGFVSEKKILQTPGLPFLDDASSGKQEVAPVPKQGIKALQEMRAAIEEKQKQMAALCTEAPTLRTKLLEAADQVRNMQISDDLKNKYLSGVPDLEQRLASVCPSADEYSPILAKEVRVIDIALGKKPSDKQPATETPTDKLPGTLVPAPKNPDAKTPSGQEPSTTKTPDEQPPAEKPARSGETARWQLQVTNISYADEYAEKYYQEKRVIEPKNQGERLILLNCKLTNKLEKTQVPVLSERLPGSTMLSMGSAGAFPPLDYDARQAINKIQGYDAASVMPGGSLDFVLVFSVPADAKPDVLLFSFLNYPDDVGGEGKSVKIPL